jgi:hypothetical protein
VTAFIHARQQNLFGDTHEDIRVPERHPPDPGPPHRHTQRTAIASRPMLETAAETGPIPQPEPAQSV